MNNRLGIIGIVVEELSAAESVNTILHQYADIIVGRMGIPYKERKVSIISVMVDGHMDQISAMTGKLGKIKDVSVKAALTK